MMRQQITRAAAAAALALAGTLGVAQAQTPPPPDDSLYRALGGLPVLQKVVDDFMANMLADRRIKHTFAESNIERVKQKLVEQFCQLSGGGCIYTGDPMREVHQGLKLSNADFNALVEDLQLAMDANGIPSHTQNRLLALLAPMQRETVSR
ncbi:group 1 truncated hemoglobin [Herbaspirillum frisingense]|nr:group 1 truncated hemoglobin [Herbaspirillum frisingense]UIN19503.1 group 1 truncated hemoglobin [Herbaspirillum frisingense]